MFQRGIRGAITVENNTIEGIKNATIELLSEIIKKNNDIYVGQFMNLNIYDEDRIVRHVYNLITSQ